MSFAFTVEAFTEPRIEHTRKEIERSRVELIQIFDKLGLLEEDDRSEYPRLVKGDNIVKDIDIKTFNEIKSCLYRLPIEYEISKTEQILCDFCGENLGYRERMELVPYREDGFRYSRDGYIRFDAEVLREGRKYKLKYKDIILEDLLTDTKLKRQVNKTEEGIACYRCVGKGLEPMIKEKYKIEEFELNIE